MSTFNFSDITLASSYAHAIKAAKESDSRDAEHSPETGASYSRRKSLWVLVKHVAAAVTEKPQPSSPVTPNPV